MSHHLPPDTLRWTLEGWEGGDDATGPKPASSFDALDAILARLADRTLFPKLTDVVIAGHSHRPSITRRDGVTFLNPGSAGPRRFSLPIALARLSVGQGQVRARIVEPGMGS